MKLRIKNMTGQTLEVEADQRDTILELKVCFWSVSVPDLEEGRANNSFQSKMPMFLCIVFHITSNESCN